MEYSAARLKFSVAGNFGIERRRLIVAVVIKHNSSFIRNFRCMLMVLEQEIISDRVKQKTAELNRVPIIMGPQNPDYLTRLPAELYDSILMAKRNNNRIVRWVLYHGVPVSPILVSCLNFRKLCPNAFDLLISET